MAVERKTFDQKYVREKIRKVFEAALHQYGHHKLIEKCKKLQKKCVNEDLFFNEFTSAMEYVFVYQEKISVDNVLSFISKYISLSYSSNDDNTSDSTVDECSQFVTFVLEFLFKIHRASFADARLRCMQLLGKILSSMPENSLISDEIWQKLKETVFCRLQDKNLAVRVQTILTARMLQDPKNANCEVIKAILFHFNDPSPAVRRAAVSSIALNKITIGHVLSKTRDVNDNVRRNAYLVFSKIKAMNLKIKFKVTVLERGLQDRSEMVRKCVEQIVVVNWLENFNRDLLKFLESLDVVNSSETAIRTIETVLKTQPKEEILSQLPIDKETHLIPKEKMTPEAVLLWRCLAHFFWKEGNDDDLEAILPSLTLLCDHITEFYRLEENADVTLSEEQKWEEVKEKEILMHLLQLIKVFDLSDEMGRLKLKKLIIDMLISPRIPNAQIKFLIELLVPVMPSKDLFIQELTEVISEIREPLRTVVSQIPHKERMERELKISDLKLALNELRELEYKAVSTKNYTEAERLKNEIEKLEEELQSLVEQPTTLTEEVSEEKNDPITLCKCLSILVEMIRCSGLTTLTPRLLNLKENFLNQCMASRDLLTQSLAIEACAQFCILDKELAKENLIRFFLMISEDGDNEVNIPSLKGVFDIIQTHGVESFEQFDQSEENKEKQDPKVKSRTLMTEDRSFHENSPLYEDPIESFTEVNCLRTLNALLYCKTNDALKSVAFEGLCKLLLSGVIYSPSILTRIVIKGFSPIIDCEYEDFTRQTFMVFFPIFASKTPRSQEMIESAFIPILKTIADASLGSPDADINPKDVIAFLIDHTKPGINHFTANTLHVHNNLALSICHEVYRELCDPKDTGYLVQIYIRSLNHLEISLECDSFVQQLNTLICKIQENPKESTSIRSFYNFKKKIDDRLQMSNRISSVLNTLTTTRGSQASKRTTSQDSNNSTSNSGPKTRSQSSLNSKVNSLRESSVLESNDSLCSVSKTARIIVPESPENSE